MIWIAIAVVALVTCVLVYRAGGWGKAPSSRLDQMKARRWGTRE